MAVPIRPNFMGLDRAWAALSFGARRGETISQRLAAWRDAGRRPGCLGCRLLDWLVEPGHCDHAVAGDGIPTATGPALRSAALLLVLTAMALLPVLAAGALLWAWWSASP